jgi:hypothetical protein
VIHTDGTPTIAHRPEPLVRNLGHAIPKEKAITAQVQQLQRLLDPMRQPTTEKE